MSDSPSFPRMDGQRAIARRMIIGLPPDGLSPAWERDFAAFTPAGVIIFARDFGDLERFRLLTARLRALARPRRIWIAMDEEGGWVSQLAGHLIVPPNALLLARGAKADELEWVAYVTAKRLRSLGIDWVFAPVADVHSQPLNPVIGARSFGAEAEPVSRAVAATLKGFARVGLASCLKHFPGHGDTTLDSHLAVPSCDADRETLERRELLPFRENLARASAVMTAHVLYPALDRDHPATFSPAIAGQLLREHLGFEGVCITDALEMKGASEERGPLEASRLALEAGCDLLLFAHHDEQVRRLRLALGDALVEGKLARKRFDLGPTRLSAFDRQHPEPGVEELAAAIESLTPPEWRPRLEGIVERGFEVRGALPAAARGGSWCVNEPSFAHGETLRAVLERHGIAITEGEQATLQLEAVMSRVPLDAAEIERLRRVCRERPVALLGLQNDAFMEQVPEAALRISAADATSLTRDVVARVLARMRHESPVTA